MAWSRPTAFGLAVVLAIGCGARTMPLELEEEAPSRGGTAAGGRSSGGVGGSPSGGTGASPAGGSAPCADGAPCDDGDFCTLDDQCYQGTCSGVTPNTCGLSSTECTMVACYSDLGLCAVVPKDGSCNYTLNLCAEGYCSFGACVGGALKDCSVLDTECRVGVCDSESGGCVVEDLPEMTPCTAEASCPGSGFCQNGACLPSMDVLDCVDGDGCCPAACSAALDADCSWDVVLDAANRGWWRSMEGQHSAENDNTFVGVSLAETYNAYLSFNLSDLGGSVLAAQLVLEQEGYFGPDASETLSIWDVSTPALTLEASGYDLAIFSDLESGISYGSFDCTSLDTGSTRTVPLDDQARNAIEAAFGDSFSVGLHLDTAGGDEQGVRFASGNEPRVLQLMLDLL